MKKTIGLLAHVDAGKTTFAEQLLFHTNSIIERGRVDHKDSFLDSHEIEKSRGITVFANQAVMKYQESSYFLIDTPGHADFSAEMERAIQVMDYAVVIISAVEGVEGHTETVWQLLRKYKIPTFFFVNKTDRVGADVDKVIEEIRLNLSTEVCDIDGFEQVEMKEQLVEWIAERDDELLNIYMEKGYDKELWLQKLQMMIKRGQAFPYSSGSALQDKGIRPFLERLDQLTDTDYSDQGEFAGRVYKVRHEENGTRITYIKALSGALKVRDEVSYCHGGNKGEGKDTNEGHNEKVTQIRLYNGNQYTAAEQVKAGELFAVAGLTAASIGDGLGVMKENAVSERGATLKSKVMFDSIHHVRDVLKCFMLLDAEDPSLHVTWDEAMQEIHIHVMGTIQLEVIEQLMKTRFHMKVTFGKPETLYKETIDSSVIGYGHFEPLKHYAEVHLRLEPGERNSGISFVNECHVHDLAMGYQNLVRQHLFEREHHGLLTGAPLTDMKVTLLTGRAHNKHTSGGDFREATYRAIRQGLEKAKNKLLEPYYDFKVKVDLEHIGRVMSDVQNAYGSFDPPQTMDDRAVLTGKVPTATFMDYSKELASYTHGKGMIHLAFSGYHSCHNETEVIERISYRKDADPEYSSSSIFCAKGHGYPVGWQEAESKMHCL